MEIKGRTQNAKGSHSYWLTEMSHAGYNEIILLSGKQGGIADAESTDRRRREQGVPAD